MGMVMTMVNYPIKKAPPAKTSVSVANRGMDLEEAINQTNEYYVSNDVAHIYKKPIPIQVVKVDYERRSAARISEAYYKVPSTTDYNGIYRGRYIDFEAKETRTKTAHLESIRRHGGIGFIIVQFTLLGKVFLLDAEHVSAFWKRGEEGRRSIALVDFETLGRQIPEGYVKRLDYLKVVDEYYFSK